MHPDEPKESCGVFAIANHPEAAKLTRLGLYALQHRGQESAGIFLLREGRCELHKGMGLVADVFDRLPDEWWNTPQEMAIGHVRYSTAGSSALVNAQPFAVEFDRWMLALAHNGNLSNGGILREHLKQRGAILQGDTDTELVLHLAARQHQHGEPPWEALQAALKQAEGAFSIAALCEDGLAVARDPFGFRPLAMGRMANGAVVFASETTAFDIIGAVYEREVAPGEFIVVRPDGSLQSSFFGYAPRRAHCIFELVYFARPDSLVYGEQVSEVRKRFGAKLAEEAPVEADMVVPVPDGGLYAALGYAAASGVPFDMAIVRNHYVGRTFIQPNASDRRAAVLVKLNAIASLVRGKRVCLVDDSIVRGNTSRERVRLLRECGAKSVHMRVSCPPHVSPCYYGIDFANRDELIANNYTQQEIADLIGVDSLAYLSREGMLSCVRATAPTDYCHACFSCEYPVPPKQIVNRSHDHK